MKTIYDLLGVHPGAADDAVKAAFRAAAKLHHPDMNPGDPKALLRFRRIAAAYAVLRDPKRRAAYDRRLTAYHRRLALERQRIRSARMHSIISGAIHGVVVGMTLAIGFLSVGRNFSTPIMTDKAEMETARGPTEMAAVQSALRDSATGWDARRDGLNVIPERKIAPSASEPATDTGDNQAIAKYGPSLHPLPNALGDVPPNQLGQVLSPR
jgi:curved DNA-binding protein CbpA